MEKFIRVEYDLDYSGGNYTSVGEFALIPVDELGPNGSGLKKAFEKHTGHNPQHIIHYSMDELYDADDNLIEA